MDTNNRDNRFTLLQQMGGLRMKKYVLLILLVLCIAGCSNVDEAIPEAVVVTKQTFNQVHGYKELYYMYQPGHAGSDDQFSNTATIFGYSISAGYETRKTVFQGCGRDPSRPVVPHPPENCYSGGQCYLPRGHEWVGCCRGDGWAIFNWNLKETKEDYIVKTETDEYGCEVKYYEYNIETLEGSTAAGNNVVTYTEGAARVDSVRGCYPNTQINHDGEIIYSSNQETDRVFGYHDAGLVWELNDLIKSDDDLCLVRNIFHYSIPIGKVELVDVEVSESSNVGEEQKLVVSLKNGFEYPLEAIINLKYEIETVLGQPSTEYRSEDRQLTSGINQFEFDIPTAQETTIKLKVWGEVLASTEYIKGLNTDCSDATIRNEHGVDVDSIYEPVGSCARVNVGQLEEENYEIVISDEIVITCEEGVQKACVSEEGQEGLKTCTDGAWTECEANKKNYWYVYVTLILIFLVAGIWLYLELK